MIMTHFRFALKRIVKRAVLICNVMIVLSGCGITSSRYFEFNISDEEIGLLEEQRERASKTAEYFENKDYTGWKKKKAASDIKSKGWTVDYRTAYYGIDGNNQRKGQVYAQSVDIEKRQVLLYISDGLEPEEKKPADLAVAKDISLEFDRDSAVVSKGKSIELDINVVNSAPYDLTAYMNYWGAQIDTEWVEWTGEHLKIKITGLEKSNGYLRVYIFDHGESYENNDRPVAYKGIYVEVE